MHYAAVYCLLTLAQSAVGIPICEQDVAVGQPYSAASLGVPRAAAPVLALPARPHPATPGDAFRADTPQRWELYAAEESAPPPFLEAPASLFEVRLSDEEARQREVQTLALKAAHAVLQARQSTSRGMPV